MKIRLVRADGERERQTDRRTDMTTQTVAFRNFTNVPEIQQQRFCNYVNTTNGLQKYHRVKLF